MTKFGPKLAYLVNLGQAMQAYSMPCCGSVGGCGARAVSRKTPIYFIDWQSQWGAFGSREWHANASPESLELQKVAGRNTWDTLTEQEQQEIRNAGANWWPNAPMHQRAYRLTITENEKWRSTLFAQLEGAAKGVQYISFK